MICNACGFENPSGMKFCGACAAPLASRCPQCGSENPPGFKYCGQCAAELTGVGVKGLGVTERQDALTPNPLTPSPLSYTPKHLADKILQSKSALEGERKQVTVLFADVKGSMDLAEQLDPEAWHTILDRFFAILSDGVHRFEGTVNQYTGDGIMALFGAPIAHEDHAQRACYAALHLQEELRRYTEEIKRTSGVVFAVRMGINSGEVVVGKIGDDLRMDYTAQGHTVGLAQRMEQLADSGKAYLSDHTARLVAGYFRLRDLGAFAVKGVTNPLHVHELEGAGTLRTRLDVSRARGLTRFVGRDDEVQTLEAALARSLEGHGQVVGVVADAGTGKSRLCFEFLERCRARGIAVNEAHAVAHGKLLPFLPILDLFRDYFGITPQDGDQVSREKIAGRMLLLDEGLRDSLPLVFDFLGVADPDRPVAPMDPEARQRQLFAIIQRVTQARSRRGPAVTLIEDLHWLDGGSAAILEVMVQTTATTRSLLLLNFRPEFHAAWMQQSSYQQLPLVPLGPEAIRELLDDLLGRDVSVAGLAATIYARTAGNPFFAEEVVQALIAAGSLQGNRGAYRLLAPVETLVVPPTVQAVLAARIDRLGEREKAVLQTAAVIGKEFTEPVLQQVVVDVGAPLVGARVADAPDRAGARPAPTGTDLVATLASLKRLEFVYEQALYPVAEFAFKHPLTQEVAYQSLLSERRTRTHAAVARALEAERGAQGEAAAVIAYHWESAGERVPAARWHDRAATWAANRSPVEAVRHWQRVRALLVDATDAPDLAELVLAACTSLLSTGLALGLEDTEAAIIFAEGIRLAARVPTANAESQLVAAHGIFLAVRGAAFDALHSVEEAVLRAGESDDVTAQCRALAALAFTNLNLGRLLPALAASERAVQLLSTADIEPSEASRALNLRAVLLALAGQLPSAAELLRRAEQLIPAANELGLAVLSFSAANLALQSGEFQLAVSRAERALDLAGRTSSPYVTAMANWMRGDAQNRLGHFAAALHSFEEALATGAAITVEGYFLAGMALAHLGLGDHDRAGLTARHAIEVARKRGHAICECHAQLTLARVLTDIEGASAAAAIEAALQEGERLIAESGARLHEPAVHDARARLAGVCGDPAGRERELRTALRLYTEMGATGHVERISHQLSAISDQQTDAERT